MPAALLSVLATWGSPAWADPTVPTPDETIVSVESERRTVFKFTIDRCTRYRGRVVDERTPEEAVDPSIVVWLVNATEETCWWDGVVLLGTLTGRATARPLPPEGLGLMLEPGKTLEIELWPDSGPGVRPVIELQLPPQGTLVLKADPDATPSEPEGQADPGSPPSAAPASPSPAPETTVPGQQG